MDLLRQVMAERTSACERERLVTRERLAAALREYLPAGSRVWVYGSLIEPGRFREWSDIDVALEADPAGMSIYLLASLLAERCRRRVDVCILGETRLEKVIRLRGESWTV
jgi:predicted nucleotidyltransferase